jgi:hypothetical protein
VRIVLALTLAVMFAATAGSVGRSARAADQRASRAPAQLKLTGTQPISVRGVAFRSAERVTLFLRIPTIAMWTKSTTASQAGVFNVTFPAARAGHCTGFTLRATGARGSTATFHRIPLPACSPE